MSRRPFSALTHSDLDTIQNTYDDGAAVEDIAAHFDVDLDAVKIFLGMPSPFVTEIDVAPPVVVQAVEKALASPSTILGRIGAATKPRAKAKPKPVSAKLTAKAALAEISEMVKRGASAVALCEVGARAGFDEETVIAVLAKIATPVTDEESGETTWTLTATERPREKRDPSTFATPGYAVSRPRFKP